MRSGRKRQQREHCSCSPASRCPSYTSLTTVTHRSKGQLQASRLSTTPEKGGQRDVKLTCVIWMYLSWLNCGSRKFSSSFWTSTWEYSFNQEMGVSGNKFQSSACRKLINSSNRTGLIGDFQKFSNNYVFKTAPPLSTLSMRSSVCWMSQTLQAPSVTKANSRILGG